MIETVTVKNPFPGKFEVLRADVQDVPAVHSVRMTLGAHMSVDLSAREARAIARALLSVADMSDYVPHLRRTRDGDAVQALEVGT
jgi:hypothetical protein